MNNSNDDDKLLILTDIEILKLLKMCPELLIQCKYIQIRYSAICLHLNHDRSYATKNNWLNNNNIRKHNKQHKKLNTGFFLLIQSITSSIT